MAQRVLFGAPGLSSGTTPLPWPTNTPCPTITDDLLPMMTLGCGEVRLDRVPSGQMIASPDSKPRRPSSQLTLAPLRVQACAIAGQLLPAPIAGIRIENTSARLMVMLPPAIDCRHLQSSPVTAPRFNASEPERGTLAAISNSPACSVICGNFRDDPRAHLQNSSCPFKSGASGGMANWLKAHAWKPCVRETVPWLRIPLSPPPIEAVCYRTPSTSRNSPTN